MINAVKELDKDEKEKKTGRFVRRERYAGSMSRSFYVGGDIMQKYNWENTFNTRDLGYTPTVAGRYVKTGIGSGYKFNAG